MIIKHGVRGSNPNPSYQTLGYGGNTPCVEIKTKKYQLIFDCGSGFSKVKLSDNRQTIIFISHFHHDHIQGLGPRHWNFRMYLMNFLFRKVDNIVNFFDYRAIKINYLLVR